MKKPPPRKGRGRNGGAKGRGLTAFGYSTSPAPPLSIAELSGVREVYWSLARQGHRLPAQRGVILIDGGANTFATATEPPPPDSGPRLFRSIAAGIIRDLELQRMPSHEVA